MTLATLKQEVARRRRDYERAVGARDQVTDALADAHDKRHDASADVEILELTQQLALALEDAWRKGFEDNVATIVSEGLELVFGDAMKFKINSETKNGASAVTFTLETVNGETSIMNAEGGSVVQVASFLLELLAILAYRPAMRKTLLLDEAFGGVSQENIPAVAQLMRKLIDESGQQIILVTHERAFMDVADVVYEAKRTDGVTTFTCLKGKRDDYAVA